MSNYRVRQVLALKLPDTQNRFMITLATYLRDDSWTVALGFARLITESGMARNTVKDARLKLEGAGRLASRRTGVGRGYVTEWTALCLPQTSPEPEGCKGVNDADPLTSAKGGSVVNPVSAPDPLAAGMGVTRSPRRGSTGTRKGGQQVAVDQRGPESVLERRANPSSSPAAAALIRNAFPDVTDDEIEIAISDRIARGARQPFGFIRHELGEGTFRLPCSSVGAAKHTEACKSGDSARCAFGWCECRCHVSPVVD